MARRPWYQLRPHRLEQVRDEVLSSHPRLTFKDVDGRVLLTGVFEVRDGGHAHDEYHIEVELPREDERGIPIVRETGGRIPRDISRHVNTGDGVLCAVLPESFWYHYPKGLSLLEFLDGPLTQHLAGQSLVEIGERWPAGEWGHGFNGVLEFYIEVLGTNDPEAILGLLQLIGRSEVKGHWTCPCGRGKRLRACHGPRVIILRNRIPRDLVRRARATMEDAVSALKRQAALEGQASER